MEHEFEPRQLTKHAFEELRMTVAEKIVGGEHWILLPGLAGMKAVFEIERRFYSACPVEDFEQTVVPFNKVGIFGYVFAAKRRLSAGKLASFLRTLDTYTVPTSTVLSKNAVICLANRDEAEFLMTNFKKWVDASVQAEAELRRFHGRWN